MSRQIVHRGLVVVVLAIAALILAADAGEYPGVSRAGLRALSRTVLPLLVVAVLNLWAIGASRRLRVLALCVNLLFFVIVARMLGQSAPPLIWLSAGVAFLLVADSVVQVSEHVRRPRHQR